MVRQILAAIIACALAGSLGAQQWNDARALSLVRQATDRRARQLSDSGLVDYRASAHGYLTFLAQMGEGFREPPQVVKADELALEVYWRAPNQSKQRIIGRRDTTLLPTDIAYHRDHLGIVQNNFPAIIRLGDGDEVRDVPHPLSASGLAEYDFAITDSLRITSPGRVVSVYEVKVRPRDDRQPRVIGALYLDRDDSQVVRMALSFTRAAFLDKDLEDLFVVLENGLVGTRFWLPRRQEIEIRRAARWLDYPVRGIIRGRWEITDYQLNQQLPAVLFTGPEIIAVASPARLRQHPFPSARILDSLPPDVRAVTAEEIKRVQAEVRELVREQALRGHRGSALAARGISDIVRFNRVEGVALGAGWSWRLAHGFGAEVTGRFGLEDQRGKGRAELSWQNAAGRSIRLFAASEFRDVSDVLERSRLFNSIAAQEFGSDFTNPYRTRHLGVRGGWRTGPVNWSLGVSRERQNPLSVLAAPARGRFEPVVPVAAVDAWRGVASADIPTTLGWLGAEYRGGLELRVTRTDSATGICGSLLCVPTTTIRGAVRMDIERPLGERRVSSRTFAGMVTGSPLLAQELIFLGGPVTAPGYDFHALVGRGAFAQRIGLLQPIPFPSIRLGRFGRAPASATLEPYFGAAYVVTASPSGTLRGMTTPTFDPLQPRSSGFYPSVGISLGAAFDIFRIDVARGLRDGRWTFSFDVHPRFWGIL